MKYKSTFTKNLLYLDMFVSSHFNLINNVLGAISEPKIITLRKELRKCKTSV